MLETLLDGCVAPRFGCGGICGLCPGFVGFRERDEAFCCIGAAVEKNVFNAFEEIGFDLFVNVEHAGIDDAHVESGPDGMEEEG